MADGTEKPKCYKDILPLECCCTCDNRVLLMDHGSNNAFGYGCIAFLKEERMVYCGGFEHGRCEMYIGEQRE